jgi:HEAT repeat protein/ATP/ADP translocase
VEGLRHALKVRSGEEPTVVRLLSLMFVVWAGAAIGSAATESLFFARFGPRYLPYMYVLVGLVTFPVMLGISAVLGRMDRRRIFATLLLTVALFVAGLRGLLLIEERWVYPPLWLGMMVVWTALGTVTWGLAGLVHDTRQAKRLFPLYGAGAILGGAVGGLLTAPLARLLHAENLLLVWTASLGGAVVLVTSIVRGGRPRRRRLPGRRPRTTGLLESMLQGARYVRRSELALWMSISLVLLNILYFSLTLPFAKAATERFADPDSLSGFLGLFTGTTNAVALILSLSVANRLFARFGVPTAVISFSFIYLAGFAVLVAAPGFAPLVATRFIQWVWMFGVWTTGWQALGSVAPAEWRQQVRAFMDGVPLQAGVLLAGVFLLGAQAALSPRQFYVLAAALAAAAVAVSWRLRRAYSTALIEALRSGWPEVFVAEGGPIGGGLLERDARAALTDGLRASEPGVRRVAVELLASLPPDDYDGLLLDRLQDSDAGVRLAALRAAQRVRSPDVLSKTVGLLADPDPRVRAAATEVVASCSSDTVEAEHQLRPLLVDPDVHVQLRAAAALVRILNDAAAVDVLERSARSRRFEVRAAALGTLGEIGVRPDLVAAGLHDEHPAVRAAAARALPTFGADEATGPLLDSLAEDDIGVRDALADALAALNGRVTSRLTEALDRRSTEDTALEALVRLPDADPKTLRSYAAREGEQALTYHKAWSSLAGHTDARVQPLVAALRHQALRHAERSVHALAPFGDHQGRDLALAALTSRDSSQRANAIETLEALAESSLVRPLVAVWEPQASSRPAGAEVLGPLLDDEDPWIRACAVFAAGAFNDDQLKQSIRDLAETDRDAAVREAASRAVEGGSPVKTLSTMSLMERVLSLGQVPLFRELSPADLRHVAESMDENAYVDGTVIAEEGDPGDVMHVVVSGEVRVVIGEGAIGEVARRGPGYIVGEMAILGEHPRMASLVTVGNVKTLSIDRKRFLRILRERPDAALAVMRELCARLIEAHASIRS